MRTTKLIGLVLISVHILSCNNKSENTTPEKSLYEQALKKVENNNYRESIPLLLKAKTTEDSLKNIDMLIGKSYFRMKQPDSALIYFNIALQNDSTAYAPYYQRGLIFFEREEYNAAIDDFKSFLEHETDAYILQMIGRGYLALKKPKEAITYFDKSLVLFDTDYYWYYTRALAHYYNNDFASMKNDCDTAISLYDKSGDVYLLRAMANYYLGDTSSACNDFNLAQGLMEIDATHSLRSLCRS